MLHEMDPEQLELLIRPAGYFRVKARRLRSLVAFLAQRYGFFSPEVRAWFSDLQAGQALPREAELVRVEHPVRDGERPAGDGPLGGFDRIRHHVGAGGDRGVDALHAPVPGADRGRGTGSAGAGQGGRYQPEHLRSLRESLPGEKIKEFTAERAEIAEIIHS